MSTFMDDFGGEENIDALNVLIGEVTDGEGGEIGLPEPSYAPEPQAAEPAMPTEEVPMPEAIPEQVTVDPNMPPPVTPSVDTAAILAQMQAQNEALMTMQQQMQQQQQPQQPEPQMTEEEMAIAELKERMGMTELEKQNADLQQKIQQQEQIAQANAQKAYQAQVESDINALKAEHNGFNPDLVARELSLMVNEPYMLPNGQPAMDGQGNIVSKAQALDNKAGWAQIWNEKFAAQQAPKPDPIVPVGNGNAVTSSKDAMTRIKEADNTLDQGRAILDLVGGL